MMIDRPLGTIPITNEPMGLMVSVNLPTAPFTSHGDRTGIILLNGGQRGCFHVETARALAALLTLAADLVADANEKARKVAP
jgi:hypothetical protein